MGLRIQSWGGAVDSCESRAEVCGDSYDAATASKVVASTSEHARVPVDGEARHVLSQVAEEFTFVLAVA